MRPELSAKRVSESRLRSWRLNLVLTVAVIGLFGGGTFLVGCEPLESTGTEPEGETEESWEDTATAAEFEPDPDPVVEVAPEPEESPPVIDTSGPPPGQELAEQLVLPPTASEPALEPMLRDALQNPPVRLTTNMLDGRWVGGEPSRFEVLVEIDGTLISATGLQGANAGHRTLFELTGIDGAHATFRAAGEGEILEIHSLFLSANEALVWLMGDDSLGVIRRVGEMPHALLGEWRVAQTENAGEPSALEIRPEHLRIVEGERDEVLTVYPLDTSGPTTDMIAVTSDGQAEFIHFRELGDETYLSWEHTSDDFAILYRAGSRPDWLQTMGSDDIASLIPRTDPLVPVPDPDPDVDPAQISTEPDQTLSIAVTTADEESARADVGYMADLAAGYYSVTAPHQFPGSSEWTPSADRCGGQVASPLDWDSATWQELAFSATNGPFQYRFVSEEVGHFQAQARVDRDCDGVYHKITIEGQVVSSTGEVVIGPLLQDSPGE